MQQEHWSTITSNIVTSLGILSFIGFYLAHRQSLVQFKFTVMLSCIERFQQLFPLVRGDDDDLSRLKKYVDLTNEECFYFQRGYIPKEVIVEWMDSIVDFFPLYVSGTEVPVNFDVLKFKQIHNDNLLQAYPRLIKCLTINGESDFSDKEKLIRNVASNLGVTLKKRHFKRAHLK